MLSSSSDKKRTQGSIECENRDKQEDTERRHEGEEGDPVRGQGPASVPCSEAKRNEGVDAGHLPVGSHSIFRGTTTAVVHPECPEAAAEKAKHCSISVTSWVKFFRLLRPSIPEQLAKELFAIEDSQHTHRVRH